MVSFKEYSLAHPEYVEPATDTKAPVAITTGKVDAHKEQPVVGHSAQFGEMMTFGYLQGFLILAVVLIVVLICARRRKSSNLKEKSVV